MKEKEQTPKQRTDALILSLIEDAKWEARTPLRGWDKAKAFMKRLDQKYEHIKTNKIR